LGKILPARLRIFFVRISDLWHNTIEQVAAAKAAAESAAAAVESAAAAAESAAVEKAAEQKVLLESAIFLAQHLGFPSVDKSLVERGVAVRACREQ